jgi:EipB-like
MNRLTLTSVITLIACWSAAAHAASLAPHRAFYDLEVKRMEQGNNISTIKGRLAYEITGSSCDGYAVSYRIANRILYAEGGSQLIDTQMSSWESGDGLEMDLTQKQFVDARLSSESRVKVKKEGAGLPGKGEIIAAESKAFETAPMAIFPAQYQLKLIDAATRGDTRDASLVFEGSDDEKSMTAISFIGTKKVATGLPAQGAEMLSGAAAWPVSISYYPTEGQADSSPQYQANFLMLDNGISTDLVMDYGSYALSGKLTKLELLSSDACK